MVGFIDFAYMNQDFPFRRPLNGGGDDALHDRALRLVFGFDHRIMEVRWSRVGLHMMEVWKYGGQVALDGDSNTK